MIPKKDWSLTPRAFQRLLEALGPDPETAGARYEILRMKLIKFFEWRGAERPEDNADQTLDRVSRRLDEGERVESLERYCYGVARLVLLEAARDRRREHASVPGFHPWRDEGGLDAEERQASLERCLAHLPPDDRKLICQYYEGEHRSRIEHRRELALRLGIPVSTLRLRAHRIRIRLEDCLRGRLGRPSREPSVWKAS
jgi:RNA polymerase sigma factor (sigma-70 family)